MDDVNLINISDLNSFVKRDILASASVGTFFSLAIDLNNYKNSSRICSFSQLSLSYFLSSLFLTHTKNTPPTISL
jgi:hypothetical protein